MDFIGTTMMLMAGFAGVALLAAGFAKRQKTADLTTRDAWHYAMDGCQSGLPRTNFKAAKTEGLGPLKDGPRLISAMIKWIPIVGQYFPGFLTPGFGAYRRATMTWVGGSTIPVTWRVGTSCRQTGTSKLSFDEVFNRVVPSRLP